MNQRHDLRKAVQYCVSAVEQWIKTRDEKSTVQLYFSQENKYRLLILRSWSLQYKLTITEILDMVMKPLRRHIAKNPYFKNKKMLLGVSVKTLTSAAAERIIREKIERRYPGNEHIAIWRRQERKVQLEREEREENDGELERRGLPKAGDLSEYAQLYRRSIRRQRLQLQKEEDADWRRRKAYRDNPWL